MKKFLVMICGPTAVGKTEVAIEVAKHFGTEIISADSRQVYREMRIGTAAPDAHQRDAVPHHLIGHISVTDPYNVSRYEGEVMSLLEGLFSTRQMVILAGGSGLYLDVISRGIDDLPDIDPALRRNLRQKYEERGIVWLQEEVARLDPDYFGRVDRMNPSRLLRALEVFETCGQPFSTLRISKEVQRPFSIIKVGLTLPREVLNQRIDMRVERMIGDGLVEEYRTLFPFRELNALNTVGYKEIFTFLDDRCTLEQAVEKIKTNTRRYAKRQMTWFKRDQGIRWFSPDDTGILIRYLTDQIQCKESQ
ncbi:MAG TPA: tRNA (adenosine(37)-N6)-dimethylallyltransferase MiaA [Bacteroidales bacterium]|nr:tRNA (adenosine(37)-N6)-dimethylallyltransferase MiaA [Bacteroidales bacterium]HRZ49089.1 tRNA (adenosine(37)-N6)-dimethylallyltransferase MiaA [Bacteroidales bacterium]